MSSEDEYVSFSPTQRRYRYRSAPSLVTRGSPTPRLAKHPPGLPSISSAIHRDTSLRSEVVRRYRAYEGDEGYEDEEVDSGDEMREYRRQRRLKEREEVRREMEREAMRKERKRLEDSEREMVGTTPRRYDGDDEFNDDSGDDSNHGLYPPPQHAGYYGGRGPPASPPPPPEHMRELYATSRRHNEDSEVSSITDEDGDADWSHDDDIDPSDSASVADAVHVARRGRPSVSRERRTTITIDRSVNHSSITDGEGASPYTDTDSDDSREISMPDTRRPPATSLLFPSDSELSARHAGVSRGRQSFRPLNARRLAGVANRATISKDNTNGEEAREEKILANMCKKICRTPQQATKLQAGNGERWSRDGIVHFRR